MNTDLKLPSRFQVGERVKTLNYSGRGTVAKVIFAEDGVRYVVLMDERGEGEATIDVVSAELLPA